MKKLARVPSFNYLVEEFKCDRCGKIAQEDDFIEYQEFITIRVSGGYGSVFGDGSNIECDLCQHCLKELVGDFMRPIEEENENITLNNQ